MGFFIFVVIAGVVIYNIFKSAKTKQEQWRVAAEHLGLGYNSADFGLTGTISGRKGGHRIVISSFSKGGGNSTSTFTKYRIDYQERIPVDFKITRQNALHKVGHAFGLQDIEIGNPAFDDRALVRGMHPQQVKEFLTPDRQEIIANLLAAHNDVMISNESIELNKPGKEKNAGVLIRTTGSLLAACNDLTDRQTPIAKEEERVIEIEAVEPSLNPFVSANPVVPDPPMVEIEDAAVGAEDEIAEPLPENTEPVPAAPAEPPPVPEEEGPVDVPEEVIPAVVAHDILAVAEDLYGADSSTKRHSQPGFDEVYLDRKVCGTGILQRVSAMSYDPVFKDRDGAIATCDICELAGAYSKIQVKADVIFPSGQFDELKNKVGSTISIDGRLIAQKAYMHHLYIVSEQSLG